MENRLEASTCVFRTKCTTEPIEQRASWYTPSTSLVLPGQHDLISAKRILLQGNACELLRWPITRNERYTTNTEEKAGVSPARPIWNYPEIIATAKNALSRVTRSDPVNPHRPIQIELR